MVRLRLLKGVFELMLMNLDEVLKYIGALSLLLGLFWSLHKVYFHFIKPKRKTIKYHKLYELIEDWFDEIDKNLEHELNIQLLYNKEKKIHQFIIDNKLKNNKLNFNKKFRREFLKFCDISEKYINDKKLFYKYARVQSDWIYLDVFINSLIASFYTFLAKYKLKSEETNFADIDMRLKLLKLYWEYKRE